MKRYQFTDGQLTLTGDTKFVTKVMTKLNRMFGCIITEGTPDGERDIPQAAEHTDPEPALLDGVQPGEQGSAEEAAPAEPEPADAGQGDERLHSEGHGQADARLSRLLEGLSQLDAGTEAHWTKDGLPKVAVVGKLAKLDDLTRREIDKAAPGFNRGD
jgi:hypothetical protein